MNAFWFLLDHDMLTFPERNKLSRDRSLTNITSELSETTEEEDSYIYERNHPSTEVSADSIVMKR